ncbi:MAG: DUF6492 family protein [Methylobacterium frigidaeris]
MSATLLTLSFRGDFELCRLLCRSVDEWVAPEIGHLLAVPRSDMALFAPLAGGRRRLVAEEELLPRTLVKLPLPGQPWRARLRLPRRNLYVSPRAGLVRGWIAQQIMKISGAARCGEDVILHVDSDTTFIRPLDEGRLLARGLPPLVRVPGADDDDMHRPWHAAASRLLGLPDTGYHGADYIDSLVVWRPDTIRALLDHVGAVTARNPLDALARMPAFSEYILYGVFCDKVLGLPACGQVPVGRRLSAVVWIEEEWTDRRAPPRVPVEPHHLTAGIQSTLRMPFEFRERAYRDACALAAAQDAEGRAVRTGS